MGYIEKIRKLIGNEVLMMPAAGVFVQKQTGEILLQKRSDNKMWGIPGGAIEPKESPEEAAIRELYEETGIKIAKENIELIGVYSGEEVHNIYPNGDEVYIVSIIYKYLYNGENINEKNDETMELKFFKEKELPSKINPPDVYIIKKYFER